MKKNQYQEIVIKAMAFIRANLDRPVSVSEIVKTTGFSKRHVSNAFRKVLNQGIAESITHARLDKAKGLLLKSRLDIAQIAFESGFENYPHFSKMFRKKMGMPASKFREQLMQLKEIPLQESNLVEQEKKDEWFRDSFSGNHIAEHWKPLWGEWHQENGCVIAGGEGNQMALLRPLPENCRISFQALVEPHPYRIAPTFSLRIADSANAASYCEFAVATGKRATGTVTHFLQGTLWNPKARMTEQEWHDIVFEINEDLLSLSVDGNPVFSLRDAFPPAYSSRSCFNLLSWQCKAQFRKMVIHNLGFRPVIHPIRQGDALYNSGLAEQAMGFYQRYLHAGSALDPETMELRYKIGMCCLKLGAYSQVKGWMDKIISLREEPFWAAQAQAALLELYWRTADLANLVEQMAICMENTKMRDGARVIAQLASGDFVSRGFFEEALGILTTWVRLERTDEYEHEVALLHLSECLMVMRCFGEAESVLVGLTRTPFAELGLHSRINLMQLYHEWGKIGESETLRSQIEAEIRDEFFVVRCRVQHALNLRSEQRMEDALKVLENIPLQYKSAEAGLLSHAKTHAALILCCLGRLEEGWKVLEEVFGRRELVNSRYSLPFLLFEKSYSTAAESLLLEYRKAKDPVSTSAEIGIKAGILHALAGLDAEAKSVFSDVSNRFPNEQVRFFGAMANALRSDSDFDFTQMPYEAHRRSDMFYLLGLLRERRGEKDTARSLFELSAKGDPALRWPAYFAEKKLGASAPK